MASANVFALFNHPGVELLDPYELQRRKLSIANALAAQQIQQQQLQTGAIGLENAQRDQAADAALRAAMGGGDPRAIRAGLPGVPAAPAGAPPPTPASVLPGAPGAGSAAWSPETAAPALAATPNGAPPPAAPMAPAGPGGAPPPPAPHELSDQEILGLMGAKGYGLITARNAAREKQALYQKASGEVESHDRDYWGSLAYAVQHSGYDPGVLRATLSQAAADGKQGSPQFQAILGAIQSGDGGLVQSLISKAIDNSPEQQKTLNERTTAEAHKQTADIAGRKSDQELFTQKLGTAAQLLGSTRDQRSWDDVLGRIDDPKVKAEFARIPWSPNAPALAREKGLSSQEQVTTAQAATNAAETHRHNMQDEANAAARTVIERSRANFEQEGGGSLQDPAYLAGVVRGEIQLNPRDKNFARVSAMAKDLDSSWSSDRFAVRQHYMQNLTGGPEGRKVQSLNQVMSHLGELKRASDALGANPFQYLPGGGYVSKDVRAYQDAHDTAGAEIATTVASGQATQHEASITTGNLGGATKGVRDTGIEQYSKLIGGRFRAVAKQYAAATGDVFPVDQFIDSDAIKNMQAAGVDPYKLAEDERPHWMRAKSQAVAGVAPAAGAPAAAAPAPAPHGIPDLGSTFNGGRVLKVTPIP